MGVFYPESTFISLFVISPLFLLNYIDKRCNGWMENEDFQKKFLILLGVVMFMIMLIIGYMLVRLWNCEENNICEDIKKSGGYDNQEWVFAKNLLRMIHIPIIFTILYLMKKNGNPTSFLNKPFVFNGIMIITIIITYGFVRRINCGEAFIYSFKSDQKKNQ